MSVLQIKFAGVYRDDVILEATNIKFKKDLVLLYNKRDFVGAFNRTDIMYIRRIKER